MCNTGASPNSLTIYRMRLLQLKESWGLEGCVRTELQVCITKKQRSAGIFLQTKPNIINIYRCVYDIQDVLFIKKMENRGKRIRKHPMHFWLWSTSETSILLASAGGFRDVCRLTVCMPFPASNSQDQWQLNIFWSMIQGCFRGRTKQGIRSLNHGQLL